MSVPEWLGDEENALREAAKIGARHGYGNVISHLAREWQIHLMNDGLDEKTARNHVSQYAPYPLDLHRPSANDR